MNVSVSGEDNVDVSVVVQDEAIVVNLYNSDGDQSLIPPVEIGAKRVFGNPLDVTAPAIPSTLQQMGAVSALEEQSFTLEQQARARTNINIAAALAAYTPTASLAAVALSGSASDLITGTLANARLSAQVARTDLHTTFNAGLTSDSDVTVFGDILTNSLRLYDPTELDYGTIRIDNGQMRFLDTNGLPISSTLGLTDLARVSSVDSSLALKANLAGGNTFVGDF